MTLVKPLSILADEKNRDYLGVFTKSSVPGFFDAHAERFTLSIQKIDLPGLGYLSEGTTNSLSVGSPIGTWQTVGNTVLGQESSEITIHFIEMYVPIIETFIYPWMRYVIGLDESNYQPFPRCDLTIKYFSPADFKPGKNKVAPTFVYRLLRNISKNYGITTF